MLNGKRIAMVAAMAQNRVIGAANQIPWKAPGEQRRFRELTEGHTVVMGRRTYESIDRPPPKLPRRDVLVMGTQAVAIEGIATCRTLEEAMRIIADDPRDDVFIAGGEQIYRLFLPYADTIYLTEVAVQPEGDAFFPELPPEFECVAREDVSGQPAYTFLTYSRRA